MSMGWIKVHRQYRNHWLYNEPRTYSWNEAWIDLLFMACFKDSKFLMDNQYIDVKRGSMVTSIKRLCQMWGWSNNKVKGFLRILENDGMITYKCDNKKTVINIVNYCNYQDGEEEKKDQK